MGFLGRLLSECKWFSYRTALLALGSRDPRAVAMGKISYAESITLMLLARGLPPRSIIVEIGSYGGLSTACLLHGSKSRGARVYAIDPFESHIEQQESDSTNIQLLKWKPSRVEVERRLRKMGCLNFELLQGMSYEVVRTWTRAIDLLWIDGNHDYEAVKTDFEEWSGFIKKGGKIAFHDSNKRNNKPGWTNYGWPGPTRLVREIVDGGGWVKLFSVESLTVIKKL